mmetsp:Transcript_8087/g.16866  ORF Transcript_8087/g.16866 Transcript_8087/m.16866 type:complete len:158 (-) Transcript_8087:170-643(-)|eukprot:CAMPEP_0172440940 /NCGR_PEP_ID=MMETSP1065-20121228/1554_1 /TAXON_ID=265537 /ORGANISM="Amphiprora paludosa, Strain CCMP125" /LENGTH=157 /DNA_ID=CAMNT_0013190061 /DNA_START=37 /DNA_END=510 /DNA_ORIENTATION=+
MANGDYDTIQLQAACLSDYHVSRGIYHASVAASIFLAFLSLCVRHVWLRDLPGAPALAYQFYMVVGILQIVIAGFVLLIFVPHCAEGCEDFCSNKYKPAYFVYPVIGTTLGAFLIKEAFRHKKVAENVSRYGESEPTQFQPVGQSVGQDEGIDLSMA